jgi:trans-aconitate 2-methyltransferase
MSQPSHPSQDSPGPGPILAPASTTRSGQTIWDPAQYELFARPRLRPALDLLQQIPFPPARAGGEIQPPRTICDLGCGPGEITQLLAARWPNADVLGVDSSPDMLARAREAVSANSLRWQHCDIAAWSPPAPVDLIYSNAALHWLGDHERLFPRLLGLLAPGGVLAVQMPLSWRIPSHRILRELLAHGDDGAPIGPAALRESYAQPPVHPPETYHGWLAAHARRIDIWTTEYLHVLEGPDPVLAWVKGTVLRPVLATLEEADKARFLARYAERLRAAYPALADGKTLFPFPRLFLVATV